MKTAPQCWRGDAREKIKDKSLSEIYPNIVNELINEHLIIKQAYKDKLDQQKEINEQIKKCIIYSPSAGEVTYANRTKSGSEDGVLIEEGKSVRERQTIIRLPDASLMRVIAKVNENRIEQIKKGMSCSITIDAIRGVEIKGEVESVSEYPLPSLSRYTAHIKEYATEIIIHNPPVGIRSGMTAKVSILSEKYENALQVPLTAIFRKNGNLAPKLQKRAIFCRHSKKSVRKARQCFKTVPKATPEGAVSHEKIHKKVRRRNAIFDPKKCVFSIFQKWSMGGVRIYVAYVTFFVTYPLARSSRNTF